MKLPAQGNLTNVIIKRFINVIIKRRGAKEKSEENSRNVLKYFYCN